MRLWPNPEVPLWHVVERHLDEADFSAELWRRAADEPDWTLHELARELEVRLSTHLEGLALPGPAVLDELIWPALDDSPDASLGMVASLVVLELGTDEDLQGLLARLDACELDDECWLGIVTALGLSRRVDLAAWLVDQLPRAEGARLAGISEALARRRTRLGSALTGLLAHHEPGVLRAAARLARVGNQDQLQMLTGLANHPDPRVVVEVVQTCILRDVAGALDVARHWAFVAPHCEFRRDALVWMSLFGDASDSARVLERIDDPTLRCDALWAASYSGRVEAIEVALAWVGDEHAGPLAGEVLTAIAGMPTDDESLWLDRPDDEQTGLPALADDDLDADLAPDAASFLPVPNPAEVRAWWQARRETLAAGRVWIAGRTLDDASLLGALIDAPLRRRHVLALLLHHRTRLRPAGALQLATRDWASSQLRELEALHRPSP